MTNRATTTVTHSSIDVGGVKIAYREAGKRDKPKIVLLHGFPWSSHQYRDLIRALSDRFHVVAPDYPGFGNSDTPDPSEYAYTFDNLSLAMEGFLSARGFHQYRLYVQDYGGPVGFRGNSSPRRGPFCRGRSPRLHLGTYAFVLRSSCGD